jgi:CPA2 family monovalent cation:H+ antiporter-2/glutathione-regulated potassium-efflux system protein KefB
MQQGAKFNRKALRIHGKWHFDAARRFLLLGFAMVFVLVFRRLGLGATLGYLLAGAVVARMFWALLARPNRRWALPNWASRCCCFWLGLN